MTEPADDQQASKRDFLKKAVYTAPAILTLAAKPSFASSGSGYAAGKGYEGGVKSKEKSLKKKSKKGKNG
jgi:hypothetical protein